MVGGDFITPRAAPAVVDGEDDNDDGGVIRSGRMIPGPFSGGSTEGGADSELGGELAGVISDGGDRESMLSMPLSKSASLVRVDVVIMGGVVIG